ncbi:GNAT family N-acetyltransferase, partial [Pseudonocardia sp. KRD-182]
MAVADGRAFGFHYEDQDVADLRPVVDPERFVLARDGSAQEVAAQAGDPAAGIVGIAGSFDFAVTLPGGGPLPAAGVTWVSVAVTHRRRGILRAMLDDLHRGYAAAGTPLAVLNASEGGIYGRFGYGVATTDRAVEVDRRRAVLRPGVPDPGGVRYAGVEEAGRHAPEVHRRWCAVQPGAVSRSDDWWSYALLDRPHQRRGASARFHLLHDDGYAAYRMDQGTCRVVDFFAATEQAHLALWRVLLALDLVTTVAVDALPADDPLPWLLTDPRAVSTTGLSDALWARVLDPAAVLGARRYAVDVDAVLQVHDPDGYADGRFRLRGGPDGAECTRTDDTPDLHLDVPALGALAFGGTRLRTLVRAGRAEVAGRAELPTPAGAGAPVEGALDVALRPEREPCAGTRF